MELDIDTFFPPAYGVAYLPALYTFYRGFDTSYPGVSDRPAYFGSRATAESYAKDPSRTVRAFQTTEQIRLIDVRFMKDILRYIFHRYQHLCASSDEVMSVILSFGLCSLKHQIVLAKRRVGALTKHIASMENVVKDDIYEQQGFRVAETNNDAITMGFLSGFLGNFVDGFLSPKTYSPFHFDRTNSMLHAEMILFNPVKSKISMWPHELPAYDPQLLPQRSVNELYRYTFGKSIFWKKDYFEQEVYILDPEKQTGGGADLELPTVEQMNMRFDEDDIQNAWNKGYAAGKAWQEFAGPELNIYIPHPHVKVRPWHTKTRKNSKPRNITRRQTVKPIPLEIA